MNDRESLCQLVEKEFLYRIRRNMAGQDKKEKIKTKNENNCMLPYTAKVTVNLCRASPLDTFVNIYPYRMLLGIRIFDLTLTFRLWNR